MNLTPHQRIMRAARRGTGLRLTAEQVGELSMDSAIEMVADNDDYEQSLVQEHVNPDNVPLRAHTDKDQKSGL